MLNPDREAVIKDKLMRAALAWKRRRNQKRALLAFWSVGMILFGVGIGTRL